MLKKFFTASVLSTSLLSTPTLADFGVPETEKPGSKSMDFFSFLKSPYCDGYGIAFEDFSVILKAKIGYVDIPFYVLEPGRIEVLSSDIKFIPCLA